MMELQYPLQFAVRPQLLKLMDYGSITESNFCVISGKQLPFRVGVHFDKDEICTAAAGNTCEWDKIPGGIVGFKLYFWQNSC